jgi:hypothetical protein
MKRPPLAAPAPANDDVLALPPLAASRAGRTLAVLLEIEDPRRDHIRVALDAFGAVAGSGFVSGTVH